MISGVKLSLIMSFSNSSIKTAEYSFLLFAAKWVSDHNVSLCPFKVYKTFGARWVGDAMAACPADVPWQRVINAQGKISSRPGAQRQRQLLEAEGILFVKDKVDLKVYQWPGPGHEDGPRQAKLF